MREIKFRGKRLYENKDWKYGFLYLYKDSIGKEFYNILNEKEQVVVDEFGSTVPTFTNVDKNSIGQYTGLKDKNGKEIYEGDILPFTMYDLKTEYYYIVFRNGEFEAINKQDTNFIWRDAWRESEVIGNIYDNPKLLEV